MESKIGSNWCSCNRINNTIIGLFDGEETNNFGRTLRSDYEIEAVSHEISFSSLISLFHCIFRRMLTTVFESALIKIRKSCCQAAFMLKWVSISWSYQETI